jgi:hypothetical protein
MTIRDWLFVATKVMGLYFGVLAVSQAVYFAAIAIDRPFGLEECMPVFANAVVAYLLCRRTGFCIGLVGLPLVDVPPHGEVSI